MKTFKRIAKNIAALLFTDVALKVLSVVFVIYVARFLGSGGFGKYSFALAFVMLFKFLPDLGLQTLMTRDLAIDRAVGREYLGNMISIKLVLSLLTFTLIYVFINVLDYPPETTLAVYVLGVYVITNSFADLARSVFRGFEAMEYEALTKIVEKLFIVSVGVIALYMGYGLIGLVFAFLAGSLVDLTLSFIVCLKRFVTPSININFGLWKHLFRRAFPFGVLSVLAIIYVRFDIVMLSYMKGDTPVGWYNSAYMLIDNLSLFFIALMVAVFPHMSRSFKYSTRLLGDMCEKTLRYVLILALPIGFGATILSEQLITVLYGNEFMPASIALRILVWGGVLSFAYTVLGFALASMDRQDLQALSFGVAVTLNVILNLVLIPGFSFIGASVARLATNLAVFILYYYFVSRLSRTLPLYRITVKPLISAVLMGLFLLQVRHIHPAITIPSATLIYFAFLFILKGFTKKDLNLMKGLCT